MRELKRKYKWLIFWFFMGIAILAFCLAVCGATAEGALSDCIDATCRVRTSDGGTGTGCAFERSQGRVFVLTCAHVVGNASTVDCEFWRAGHCSRPIRGSVIGRSTEADAAIVSIPESSFGGVLPKVIPIAPRDYTLRPGSTITSVGCANGAWSTGWKGHLLGYQGSDLHFRPTPADGRSGSAVFDAKGEMIVGLLRARTLDGSQGIASSLNTLYQVFSRQSGSSKTVKPEERITQCPGGICPSPSAGPGQGASPWRLSPYRQGQDQWNERQDGRLGQIERVWPTLPGPGPSQGQPSTDLSEVVGKLDQVIELLKRQQGGAEIAEAEQAKADTEAAKAEAEAAVEDVRKEQSKLAVAIQDLVGDRATLQDRFEARIAKVKEELGPEASKKEVARAYVKDLAGEKLGSGAVGMTLGKLVAGTLGLSGPLAFAVAGGAWLISRRIGRKIEAGDPLLIELLADRIKSLVGGDDDEPAATQPRKGKAKG